MSNNFKTELNELKETFQQTINNKTKKLANNLITAQNNLYTQLESLSWLQRSLAINGRLPPLRGWAASPDVLLKLHSYILNSKPLVIVECGSGASTLVIADALRQNGMGQLISLEHDNFFGTQTLSTLQNEQLQSFVDLRICELQPWKDEHLNSDAAKPSLWYSQSLLNDIESIDLLWVDGPPGGTCLFSRYPALPALANKLSSRAEVWMDDTIRQEEKEICEHWANDFGFKLEYYALEKGLGRLKLN